MTLRTVATVLCLVGYLKSVSGLPVRLVRVYSETVEYEDFPMPGHVTTYKTRARLADSLRDTSLQSISLHHLVRDGDSSVVQFIRAVDQRLRRHLGRHDDEDDDGFPTPEELELYRAAIKEREQELLTTADVILCTCVASGASRITSSTNIVQVLSSVCLSSLCTWYSSAGALAPHTPVLKVCPHCFPFQVKVHVQCKCALCRGYM